MPRTRATLRNFKTGNGLNILEQVRGLAARMVRRKVGKGCRIIMQDMNHFAKVLSSEGGTVSKFKVVKCWLEVTQRIYIRDLWS